jgi:hypothetical protein
MYSKPERIRREVTVAHFIKVLSWNLSTAKENLDQES